MNKDRIAEGKEEEKNEGREEMSGGRKVRERKERERDEGER